MPDYNFTSLSPSDFEILMRDLLAAKYGLHFEAFAQGADGGVDLRAFENDKKTVVQCKHYSGSKFADLKRAATKEREKMEQERPNRYLFATTQNLTKQQKDKLHEILGDLLASPSDILCRTDINGLLSMYPEVEKAHFKLWLASTSVLQRIVNSGIWARSEALMESIQSRVRLYVSNASYKRAADMLAEIHMVAITGAPGVGKSMLAEMLLLTHWEEGWQVVTLDPDLNNGWTAWNRDQPQIFIFDDFLGQTDLSERSARTEGSELSRFIESVMSSNNKRLILTTRSHILQQAEIRDEPLAHSDIGANQCIVEVKDFDLIQRSYLLYNHLYFSRIDRAVVRDFAKDVDQIWNLVIHPNFTPRIVQFVCRGTYTSAAELANSLRGAFDRPVRLWGPSFETGLSETARRILLSLALLSYRGVDEQTLRETASRKSSPLEYKHALKALEGSWIEIRPSGESQELQIAFANPSCRDFVLSFLDSTPEYIPILLAGGISIHGVRQLLSYAVAGLTDTSGRKFTGLWNFTRQNSSMMLSKVRSSWRKEFPVDSEFNDATAIIATMIKVDRDCQLGWDQWISGAISETARARARGNRWQVPDFIDAHEVINYIESNALKSGSTLNNTAILSEWVEIWIEAGAMDDQWLEVREFASLHTDGPIAGACDINAELAWIAEQWLEQDLSDLASRYNNNVSWIDERISEIKLFSEKLGIYHKIEDEIDRAYVELSEIQQKQANAPDCSPRSAESAFSRSDNEIQTAQDAESRLSPRRVVQNLFTHLQ
ncbi:nSTAND3 domain-containing NTPase [Lentzea nigeriaca]|uniref:nSTAND3 domain-containing NTPase n=1 Tax=Lentzea nigeriaca TaxID=1128665 RepID=UPI001956DFCC|nr:restriction endonuclease [Lentzea nigeriaca]MBM7858269.1 hypothetical protein [Lentzea nigeriaca]